MGKGRNKGNLVYGIGVNDSTYRTRDVEIVDGSQRTLWVCPYYQKWRGMLKRCYSDSYHKNRPTYKDCTVCEEWLTFSNFKAWMETQDWKGNHLDKDLLVEGNKVYSPDTCVFVERLINMFLTDRGRCRGDYLIGVHYGKGELPFIAQCSNPITKSKEWLGRFTSEECAHLAWKARKHELAHQLILYCQPDDPRVAEALATRYL